MHLSSRFFQYLIFGLLITICSKIATSSVISSSEVQMCQRTTSTFDPMLSTGNACHKKMLVALAVRNGQGESGSIYADIKFVDNKTGPVPKKEQLKKPFRITVTKSEVHIHYPLQYLYSVNNEPFEKSFSVKNTILGIRRCNPHRNCQGLQGYCCYSSMSEKLSRAWEYKRGVGRKVGHYHSHKYSQAICMGFDQLNYNVFEVKEPYLSYKINVTVQQLDYKEHYTNLVNNKNEKRDIWRTIGFAEIGPETIGQNTKQNQVGKASGPEIKAVWLGDFKMNTYTANFNSKYLLTPDWRASSNPSKIQNHPQVQGGANEWLILDRYLLDNSGHTCNKIGVGLSGFRGQQNRCYQEQNSCFKVTPKHFWDKAKLLQENNIKSHYFPTFYGDFLGPHQVNGRWVTNTSNIKDFQLVYRSSDIHKSLITLTFTADTISFVENRSQGRIVEALMDDFMALMGSGVLNVVVQNIGVVTADFSISIDQCTDGIIRVSDRSKTIDPRQQMTFEFQISASMNKAFNHSCNVELTDREGNLLDIKQINFKTEEGCVYCPAGQCRCSCQDTQNEEEEDPPVECKDEEFLNPYWEPKVIVIRPCYHCWITNSLKNPVYATFIIVICLMSLGMIKMLIAQCCCRTKDGRPIDVVGVILGTTSAEHTRMKQRSTTIQFLLGACFFVYLPLLPLLIVFCNWRRRRLARKRLRKKAERKKKRLLQRKQAALAATQGLMVLGDEDEITMDDALKAFDKAEPGPTILIISSSSDTDEQDFNYSTSSDTDVAAEVFGEEVVEELKPLKGKKKKGADKKDTKKKRQKKVIS